MVAKKKVSKKAPKIVKAKKSKPIARDTDSLKKKKTKSLVNFIRALGAFIIFFVLYFVTSNPILEVLFGLGALITGAIAAAFILIFVSVLIFLRTHKKKR